MRLEFSTLESPVSDLQTDCSLASGSLAELGGSAGLKKGLVSCPLCSDLCVSEFSGWHGLGGDGGGFSACLSH